MKIKKGDNVVVLKGKDKGKKGKVERVFLNANKALVAGINVVTKHQKPKKSGEKGQIVELPGLIQVSNAKLICSRCGKAVRVGYKLIAGKKSRVCKRCEQSF